MASTQGLIKKAKEDLQNLHREYLKVGDEQERKLIEFRIKRQIRLLAELGAA